MPGSRAAVLVAALLASALSSGCGRSEDASVRRAAEGFAAALAAGSAAQACAQLAPLTRAELESSAGSTCVQALPGLGLPRVDRVGVVKRYGRQASVRTTGPGGPDTWFLSRHGRHWLVSAAGCTPRVELPHDCALEGP